MFSKFIDREMTNIKWMKKETFTYDKDAKYSLLHITKGPAVSYLQPPFGGSGFEMWFLEGVKYERSKDCISRLSYSDTHINHPSVVWDNGTKEWWMKSFRHREDDLPAVLYSNGDVEYWRLGRRHRLDGPAVIIGDKQYFFKFGEFIKCI